MDNEETETETSCKSGKDVAEDMDSVDVDALGDGNNNDDNGNDNDGDNDDGDNDDGDDDDDEDDDVSFDEDDDDGDESMDSSQEIGLLRKPRRVKGSVRSDGCIVPHIMPVREASERFRRPVGRQPRGMRWDSVQGLWAPKSRLTRSVGYAMPNYQEPPSASSDEEYFARRKQKKKGSGKKSKTKRSKNEPKALHPRSHWREPARLDGLTLYERHRKPRPVVYGRVERPLKDVLQEFRCVICLGCIHNAVVAGCLHRFCEDCIDQSMRIGRNECPICRVTIPSRRSLAPDPAFDRLVVAILGKHAVEGDLEDINGSNAKHRVKAVNLQKAILQKREAAYRYTESELKDEEKQEKTLLHDGSSAADMMSTVIDIVLIRHEAETILERLDLPYLRLEEKVTIDVLKKFLRAKLGRPNAKLQIGSYSAGGKYVIFTDWMTLYAVVTAFSRSSQNIIKLYYRTEPPKAARPSRAIYAVQT